MFNIRVYGILSNKDREILVSDEFIRGNQYTKFPGGGLEFGEGTRDCLVREFMEEMNLAVRVTEHLYTTDFFQMSAFNPEHQIISIYYRVEAWRRSKSPCEQNCLILMRCRWKFTIEPGKPKRFALFPGKFFLRIR